MMYVFDFFEFIFSQISELNGFMNTIFDSLISIVSSLGSMIGAFPLWVSIPFTVLLSVAILFRVSQFVPTIGGAN